MDLRYDILVADGDVATVDLITEVLRDEGYSVRSAWDGNSLRRALAAQRPTLMLLDLHMPGANGTDLIDNLCAGLADVTLIIMSTDAAAVRSFATAGRACLAKPFTLDELLSCIAAAASTCGLK